MASKWQTYKLENLFSMPNDPGVYVLYLDSVPVRVGKSGRCLTRIYGGYYVGPLSVKKPYQNQYSKGAVTIKVRFCYDEFYAELLESFLIWKLQPKFNKKFEYWWPEHMLHKWGRKFTNEPAIRRLACSY